MRAGLLVLVAGCSAFDPVAQVPHQYREVSSTAAAISMILAENPDPRVYAIGEYHQSRTAISATSPLARFSRDIIGMLEPHAHHLIVEAWLDAACWSSGQLSHDVAAATGRPASTAMEMMRLVTSRKARGLVTHGLPMTCIEHDAMIDASGRVDFLLLLEVITDKLAETTRLVLETDRAVIVYGGALHNDLYPHWPLEELSYAKPLARELGGHVLEIDLVVPEVVAPMPLIRTEDWFPLLTRAAPNRVIVWRRGPASYVVILPTQDVTKVAKLADVM
jgi:hypothetical protein